MYSRLEKVIWDNIIHNPFKRWPLYYQEQIVLAGLTKEG